MSYVTYKELTAVCGKQRTYAALLIIERSAEIKKDNIVFFDCEKRLRHALEAMCDTEQAA